VNIPVPEEAKLNSIHGLVESLALYWM